jgi:MFS family permease
VGFRETWPGRRAATVARAPDDHPVVDAATAVSAVVERLPADVLGTDAASRDQRPPATAAGGPAWLVFGVFLVLTVAIHAAAFQWVITLPIHATGDLGLTTAAWGLLFALNGILILVFQLRIMAVAESRNRPRFRAVGALWYAAGYLVVALVPGVTLAAPALAATVVLVTIGEMCIYPVEPAFMSELSPPERRGRDQGLLGAAIGLGTAIGPLAGGIVLDVAPGPALWLLTALVCLATAAGLWWLGGRIRRTGPAPTAIVS